jgi:hypothetical protein
MMALALVRVNEVVQANDTRSPHRVLAVSPANVSSLTLLVIDRPVLADVVKLALNHGHYQTPVVPTVDDAATALIDWLLHLIILDIDNAGSAILERRGGFTAQAVYRLSP